MENQNEQSAQKTRVENAPVQANPQFVVKTVCVWCHPGQASPEVKTVICAVHKAAMLADLAKLKR